VVIDEIHRLPGLFEVLRGIMDDWRALGERSGHFLLLGSAGIELMQQASERLCSRCVLNPAMMPAERSNIWWVNGHFFCLDFLG